VAGASTVFCSIGWSSSEEQETKKVAKSIVVVKSRFFIKILFRLN
jgi:hypothetical protein